MMTDNSVFLKIFTFQCLLVLCVSQNVDFYYFVQQWPGSICDTKEGCCHPKTGKPAANFTIHGLWPYSMLGSAPTYCNSHNPYNESKISDLTTRMKTSWPSFSCPSSKGSKLWSNEWKKHGTCSGSNQHQYFEAALRMKDNIDVLKILKKSGITPNGRSYSLDRIYESIMAVTIYSPGIYCNVDSSGKKQLHLIYLCPDGSGTSGKWMDCPGFERGNCASKIKFPSL